MHRGTALGGYLAASVLQFGDLLGYLALPAWSSKIMDHQQALSVTVELR